MRFFGLTAAIAAMATILPTVTNCLTEEEWARLAQDFPSKTEQYIQNMKLVSVGQKIGVDRTGWVATADSSQSGDPPSNVLDSNTASYWITQQSPTVTNYPHQIVIDMLQNYWVTGVTYLPQQGSLNGTVGYHRVSLSTDGQNWGLAKAYGRWYDDNELKTSNFTATQARYIRLMALGTSANNDPFMSAADINIYSVPSYTAPNPAVAGAYGVSIDFPTIMVAAAVNQGTGEVIAWSSYQFDAFLPSIAAGKTYTSLINPAAKSVSEQIISNTDHDMFCPGLSRDSQGRPIVTGGNNAFKTSMYDPSSNTWTALPQMNTARGYQGQTTLSDGRIFTIGGSFSGGSNFYKNGEVFSFATNAWQSLPGALVQPMLTNDRAGLYRSDNHGWLMAWRNGSIFQAGPSKNMNWYSATGNGGVQSAGTRGSDNDAMNGNIAFYDASQGLLLAVGGSPDYDNSSATSNANIIQIGNPNTTPTVTQINNMNFPRAFANSVILPDGNVFIVGGQTYPVTFTDTDAVMIPEMWSPVTRQFTQLAPLASIRTYHSTALLLPDASIIIGGGGLCGNCTVNHFDAQIYYPPYFYNPAGALIARPVINSVSATTFAVGTLLTVKVNTAVTRITMMRYGSATHALDTDQRRVPLTTVSQNGSSYVVQIPNDTGIMIPGAWMVFAMASGVPSVATSVIVTN